jgi:hypothetical protein
MLWSGSPVKKNVGGKKYDKARKKSREKVEMKIEEKSQK